MQIKYNQECKNKWNLTIAVNSENETKVYNLLLFTSLVQDYFLETLEERDYFGREATYYGFIRDIC